MIYTTFLFLFIILKLSNQKEFYKSFDQFLNSETERLKQDKIPCNLKKLTRQNIENERLKFLVQEEKHSEACYIKYLSKNSQDGYIWSLLGDIFNRKEKKYTSQALFCFKQASKLAGKHTAFIKIWNFLGPFVIGKIEFDGDPLEAFGGIKNISKYRFADTAYYSELIPTGKIRWKTIQQDSVVTSIHVASTVPWNDLVSSLGSMAITEWQGWLVGDFAVNNENKFVFQCLGVTHFYIDNVILTGDVYYREHFWFGPVVLNQGIHTIYIPVRTKVQASVKCSFKMADRTFAILGPTFKPDLYDGYIFGKYISVPISNFHNSKWLKNIKVSIVDQSEDIDLKVKVIKNSYSIAPGQTRPIIIQLLSKVKLVPVCSENGIDLKIKISTSEGGEKVNINLRCRNLDQSVLFTFLDHDGSVQQAAAIAPIGTCDMPVCPLFITLHGTTVPPQNQADSYKQMVNGQFIFGVKKMWLLAPTRHGAHNWEGPGLLTALQSMKCLEELVQEADWLQQKLDIQHLIVAGHSMGGHGAWHVATHYPDRVMALISLAGWIKKEEYGDSNFFFKHDISTSHTDPSVKHIMESCISENDVDKHITNLKGIPVYVRIGASDRTVHPYYNRRMVRLLHEVGVDVQYTELEGKEHWWWDTSKTNDGGVVNDKPIRTFIGKYSQVSSFSHLENCDKDGECKRASKSHYTSEKSAEEFTLVTINPALGEGIRGIQILQQKVSFRISTIKVTMKDNAVTMVTTNVLRLKLSISANRKIEWWNSQLQIDGTDFTDSQIKELHTSNSHFKQISGGRWEISNEDIYELGERGPENLGPARRIAEKEFLIVVGSSGHEDMKKSLLMSAMFIANLFLLTSDTIVNVVMDTDISSKQIDYRNVIILGSPMENKFTEHFLSKIPIRLKDKDVTLEDCIYKSNIGVLALSPNGLNNLAMIIFGNSIDGLLDAISLAKPTIPPMTRSPFSNLIPDFVITGPEFKLKGPGGFLCSGFWDNQWKYKSELSSCVC